MRYEYGKRIQKPKRWWIVLPAFAVLAGGYAFFSSLGPALPIYASAPEETVKKLTATKPALNENRLYVPKINIDLVAVDSNEALAQGATHRSPESGNPKDGGNYVLAAHRFQLGLTPQQTRSKSPFYHMDKLNADDDVYVDYGGIRYAYKVTERKLVDATTPDVEMKTDKDQLTLFSIELSGPGSTREVVIAKPTGTIVWQDGAPKLKTL